MDNNMMNNYIPDNTNIFNNIQNPFYANQTVFNNNNFNAYNNFNNNNFNNNNYNNNNFNNNNNINNPDNLRQEQYINSLLLYQQQNNNILSNYNNNQLQNNQNQNTNTIYIKNNNDNNNINNNDIDQNTNIYINNNEEMMPIENKDNSRPNLDYDIETTPKGESGEINNYLEEWKKEKVEDNKIKKELKKQETMLYSRDKTKFSYDNFTKAPTTYIYKSSYNSNAMTYLTTVIHCLANIPPIAKYFLKNKIFFVKNMFKYPFNYYFSRFISNIYSYPEEQDKQFYQTFSIDEFRDFVINKNRIFQGTNSIKDAEIFFNFFLQTLHEELIQFTNKKNKDIEYNSNFKEYYKELLEINKNSIIFDCFSWIRKKKITCTVNHSFIEFQHFFSHQLDIKNYIDKSTEIINNSIKISDLINYDLTSVPLYNINCTICKKKIKDNVTNYVSISPNYFIFLIGLRNNNETLQKFIYNTDSKEKYRFIIDTEINLENIMPKETDDYTPDLSYTINNSHKRYQLDALIGYNFKEQNNNKIGYIAYYRSHIDNSWYLYSYKELKKIDITKELTSFQDSLIPSILIYSHK